MSSTPKLTKKQKKAIAFRERKSKGKGKDVDGDDLGNNEIPEMEIQDLVDTESLQVEDEEQGIREQKQKTEKNAGKKGNAKGDAVDKGKGKTNSDENKEDDGNAKASTGKKRKRDEAKSEGENVDMEDSENVEGRKPKKMKKEDKKYLLFVGNLKYTTSKEAILSHFSACDPPPEVRLLTPKASSVNPNATVSKSKGCAFLEFTHPHALQQALKLHHSQLDGRSINVELTAGGGGKGEARMNKVKDRNKKLFGERENPGKNAKKKAGTATATGKPQRFSSTSGADQVPETKKTWTVGDVQEDKTHRGGQKHKKNGSSKRSSKAKDWSSGANAIPVG